MPRSESHWKFLQMWQQHGATVSAVYELSLAGNELDNRNNETWFSRIGFIKPVRSIRRNYVLNFSAHKVALIKGFQEDRSGYPEGLVCTEIDKWEDSHEVSSVTPKNEQRLSDAEPKLDEGAGVHGV